MVHQRSTRSTRNASVLMQVCYTIMFFVFVLRSPIELAHLSTDDESGVIHPPPSSLPLSTDEGDVVDLGMYTAGDDEATTSCQPMPFPHDVSGMYTRNRYRVVFSPMICVNKHRS